MFWRLILAHLLADYPLQPKRLVKAKKQIPGMLVHTGTHLLMMFILAGSYRLRILPQLLAITLVHFFLDRWKLDLSRWRPRWVILPYLIDQTLHFSLIFVVSRWIVLAQAPEIIPPSPPWVIYAIGFLAVTYVWYVTEWMLANNNQQYRDELEVEFWPRMAVRTFLLAAIILLGPFPTPFISAMAFTLPYRSHRFWRRALITDLSVTFLVASWVYIVT